LVTAARAGQAWAFAEIWQRFSPVVAGYLRGRGAAEPDDLTSDVFVAVFERVSGFHGDDEALRAFVFTVAHHRLVDDIRRQRRRQPALEYQPDTDQRAVPSAEDEALAAVRADGVRRMLEQLPDDQRDVLLLRIIGDLSLEQTAAVLGKSTGAVKSLQHRALNAVRRNLGTAVSR
jgi:RNA polymerase sigma-70 factor (ECF subfamily)